MLVPSGNVASAWQQGHGEPRPFDGTLSVLTYNVKGLPWPLASGRPEAFSAMADRLRDMRAEGRNPHIVVLQEAFTQGGGLSLHRLWARRNGLGPSAHGACRPPASGRRKLVEG